jgi:hypothetical protein
MSIKTADGRTIEIVGLTYKKVASYAGGSLVITDIVRNDGSMLAGPLMTGAEWKQVQLIQKLRDQFVKADSKATDYYKQSRFMIVNRTATDSKISKVIDMMTKWEVKRDEAQAELAEMGVYEF